MNIFSLGSMWKYACWLWLYCLEQLVIKFITRLQWTVPVWWGGGGGGDQNQLLRVAANLNRRKQCLIPPLDIVQIVRVSVKFRVMETIWSSRWEASGAAPSCLTVQRQHFSRTVSFPSGFRRCFSHTDQVTKWTDAESCIVHHSTGTKDP